MMNSKKKQTVAAAMATALGITAMMSPVVYAQEEDAAPAITQETATEPAQDESNTPTSPTQDEQIFDDKDPNNGTKLTEKEQLIDKAKASSVSPSIASSRSDDAFTDYLDAINAITGALSTYEFTNETTEQEILNFLNHEFVDTGKIKSFERINIYNKIISTETSTGDVKMAIIYDLSNKLVGSLSLSFTIPRLPKEGEVAINSTNFPDKLFRDYLKKAKDRNGDGVLDADEINQLTTVNLSSTDYQGIISLKGIEYFPMLEDLKCQNTSISVLDVSSNQNLKVLDCSRTNIGEMNVSKNQNLVQLYCDNTGISELNVSRNQNLKLLSCFNTGISELDVKSNKDLKFLSCSNTNISELDVSSNQNLELLYCYKNSISELNVSSNQNLKYLYCFGTGISELDVSSNQDLEELYCNNTGISKLDISENQNLNILNCEDTPLAWLNLGDQHINNINNFRVPTSSIINLAVTDHTFDIEQAFKGINLSKVTITSGANLKDTNLTDYEIGTPITYTYDCGTNNGDTVKMYVTLNLAKSDSRIEIIDCPDMEYTGNPYPNPSYTTQGSKSDVTFTYEVWNGSQWVDFNNIPTNAGKYRVQAHVASDEFYNKADSSNKEFKISQAMNSWTKELKIKDWTYGEQANDPTAAAKYGNVVFTYSNARNGIFTDEVPVNAGTWYVKAYVAETDNYSFLEKVEEFHIEKAENTWLEKLHIKDWKENEQPNGPTASAKYGDVVFTYSDARDGVFTSDVPKTTGTWYVKATVTETENYNKLEDIKAFTILKRNNQEKPDSPEDEPADKGDQPKEKEDGSVQTGDNSQAGLMATLAMLSAGCIAFMTGKKRKSISNNKK